MPENQDSNPSKSKLKVRDPYAHTENKSSKSSSKVKGKGKRRKFEKKDPLELAAKITLTTGVVAAPWAFGSVSALAQIVWCVMLFACICLWLAKCIIKKPTIRLHCSLILVLLFLALAYLQLFNLPSFASENLSKKQGNIRNAIASSLEQNHAEASENIRKQSQIALNLPAAKYQTCYFVLIGATVFLGSRFFGRRRDLLALATIVGINGALIAVFGAFQKVVQGNTIYGIPLKFGGVPYGPFVNRNNGAGYLLICLGCAISVLVYSFSYLKTEQRSQKAGLEKEGPIRWLIKQLRVILANLSVKRILLVAICGLMVCGVVLSLSRGGMISMAVAFSALLLLLFRVKRYRAMVLLIFFFVPFGAGTIAWTGLQESVSERLQTLGEEDVVSSSARAKLWKDSVYAVNDYPLFGSGAGSFPYVYKEYQSFPDTSWNFHAENVFLEVLITMGVLGFLVGVIFLAILFRYAIKLPKNKDQLRKANPKSIAVGIMLFFGIMSQLVSNFFDFGLLIPANGFLFALLVGASLGVVCAEIEKNKVITPIRFSLLPYSAAYPSILILGVLLTITGADLFRFHRNEVSNLAARSNHPEDLSHDEIKKSIEKLEATVKSNPNLESHQYLAQLYVLDLHHSFTDHELAKIDDQEGVSREDVFNQLTMRILNFQFAGLDPERRQAEVERLSKLDFIRSNVKSATHHYLKSLEVCPLNTHAIVGLAELAFLNSQDVEPYINAFKKLNVQNPDWYLRLGDVAVAHDKKETGFQFWRRSIELAKNNYKIVVPTAILFFDAEAVCNELIPEDAKILDEIAEKYFPVKTEPDEREMIYERIVEILSKDVYTDSDTNYLMGKAYMETGQIIDAISSFETATAMAPLNFDWKAKLANLYYQVGEFDKALDQIDKCLSAEKDNPSYLELKRQITK